MQRLLATFSFVVFFVCTMLGSMVLPAYAQNLGATSVQPLTLSVSPQYPAPYQTVAVTPQSTTFDISNASIKVSVNGVQQYSGTGGNAIPVTVGGPGATTRITVTATVDGSSYTQTAVLHPASVALIVEPISTTHAFYSGRALVPASGHVRIVAVPDLRSSPSTVISPSSLIYIWKLGDQELQNNSGVGQDVLDAIAPQQYRNAQITLTVQNQSGTIIAQSGTIVTAASPLVEIYENDPLMGPLFDNALSNNVVMPDAEDTYRGVPYYFSSTPSTAWTLNGTQSGTDPDITVRALGSGQGTATLGFTASQSNPLQSAAESLSVLFGQKASTGIFGL